MRDRHLRVATWNIHSCIGSDGIHDPGRVRSLVKSMGADILALQEVDSRVGDHDGFRELAGAIGPANAHCRTLQTPDGDYGHMLLTRWAIRGWTIRDISVAGREPRSVIDATVDTPCGLVRVLSTHLGLGRRERSRQVKTLNRMLDENGSRTILLGDFNEPTRFGPATRAFARRMDNAGLWPTFPSRRPVFPLDRIWCSSPLRVDRSRVPRNFADASDHLPVIAELAWQ